MKIKSSEISDKKEQTEIDVEFPDTDNTLSQDREWCLVSHDGETRRIRFHDYNQIYAIPGLYEEIFYNHLKCRSPYIICSMLEQEIIRSDMAMEDLRVLDVGAGNGIMGEQLMEAGVDEIVGVDIIEEARDAAIRDRPGVYDEYYTVDLTDIPDKVQQNLEGHHFNCMTLIAALGFGDIPTEVFSEAYNLVDSEGWVAFNIKHDFLARGEESEFSELINQMIDRKWFDPTMRLRYQHRLAIDGSPIDYTAFIGRKIKDIPDIISS